MFSFLARLTSRRQASIPMTKRRKSRVSFEMLEERGVLSGDVGPIINPANGHTYYQLTQSKWTD
jgi:hypothetical protein